MHFILFFLTILFFPISTEAKPTVLVSVAPHRYFVSKIAGDTVHVQEMVPAGASAHTFEPTPKQMISASNAKMWFTIGESFEKKVIETIKSYNPNFFVYDLRKGISLIHDPHHCCQHATHSCEDLHFWLSPRLAKIQAKTITNALIEQFPHQEKLYNQNLNLFVKELEELDAKIQTILLKPHNSYILVSHPAYAYFCRDYNFEQLSIEYEGKDPTPQKLTKTLQLSKAKNISVVFIQPQYSSKGAKLVAKEIGAKIVTLNPYSENYAETLLSIAQNFADQAP